MEKKVLKAKCIFCGKEVYSLYQGQLNHNIKVHELSCVARNREKKMKGGEEI